MALAVTAGCRVNGLVTPVASRSVEVAWAAEQDHVIQRADGTALYNLASVVDDQDMQITHVIRAAEHLSNTPRQIFMAQGLGYSLPEYAHVPFVAEPGSKQKLSKRRIGSYLKHHAFRKLYDHGAHIAKTLGIINALHTLGRLTAEVYYDQAYRNGIDSLKQIAPVAQKLGVNLQLPVPLGDIHSRVPSRKSAASRSLPKEPPECTIHFFAHTTHQRERVSCKWIERH